MTVTRWAIALTMLLATAITILTLTPPTPAPMPAGSDKLSHFVAFMVLAVPLAVTRPRWNGWLFLAFSAFGATIEILQPYVGRSRELADLIADMLGIASGMALGLLVSRLLPTLSRSTSSRAQD